jgi:hypothetical protein
MLLRIASLNITQIAALALNISVPEENSLNDVFTQGTMDNVNFIVDKTLSKDEFHITMDDVTLKNTNKEVIKGLVEGLEHIKEMPSQMEDVLKTLSIKERDEISDLKSGAFTFIGIFTNDPEFLKSIKDTKKYPEVKIFRSSSKAQAEALGVEFPGAFGYNSEDGNIVKLPFHNSIDSLVAAVSIPAFSAISKENYKYLQSLNQNLLYVIDDGAFLDNKKKFNSSAKLCSSFAKFIFFSPEDVPALIPLLNIKEGDYPLMLSLSGEGKSIVRSLKQEGFLNAVQSLITKTAEKLVFSSPIPEDNDSLPVKVVNTDSLSKVFQQDLDTLIAFVTPSCQYCVKLISELQKFSESLMEKNVPAFVGTYNVMENEEQSQYQLSGYPTLYFKKKGQAQPNKVPSEVRSYQQLIEYLAKEGSSSINPEDFKEKEEEKPKEQEEEDSGFEEGEDEEVL